MGRERSVVPVWVPSLGTASFWTLWVWCGGEILILRAPRSPESGVGYKKQMDIFKSSLQFSGQVEAGRPVETREVMGLGPGVGVGRGDRFRVFLRSRVQSEIS